MSEERMIRLLGAGTLSVLVAILCLIFAIITRPKIDPQVKPATFFPYQLDNSAQENNSNSTTATSVSEGIQTQDLNPPQETAVDEIKSGQGEKYTVESGDTLYGIATKFNKDWKEIAKKNGISEATSLQVGQELVIP